MKQINVTKKVILDSLFVSGNLNVQCACKLQKAIPKSICMKNTLVKHCCSIYILQRMQVALLDGELGRTLQPSYFFSFLPVFVKKDGYVF